MKENWVNYLISRRPHLLGEASVRSPAQLGALQPSLFRQNLPPMGSKYGSDLETPRVDAWALPFLPFLGTIATKTALHKHASDSKLDLGEFLAQDFRLLKYAYEKIYRVYPGVKAGFDGFYGPDFFRRGETTAMHTRLKLAEMFTLPPPRPRPPASGIPSVVSGQDRQPARLSLERTGLVDQGRGAAARGRGRTVRHGGRRHQRGRPRAAIARSNVLIKDERDPEATSEMPYRTQVAVGLTNPDEDRDSARAGSARHVGATCSSSTGRSADAGPQKFCTLVRKSDPRNWMNTAAANIWVDQEANTDYHSYRKFVDGLGDVSSFRTGGTYMVLDADPGAGTCPFAVKEDYGDGVYRVNWHEGRGTAISRGTCVVGASAERQRLHYRSWDAVLRLNKRPGTRISWLRGEVTLPEQCKVLKIADPPRCPTGQPWPTSRQLLPREAGQRRGSVPLCACGRLGAGEFSMQPATSGHDGARRRRC